MQLFQYVEHVLDVHQKIEGSYYSALQDIKQKHLENIKSSTNYLAEKPGHLVHVLAEIHQSFAASESLIKESNVYTSQLPELITEFNKKEDDYQQTLKDLNRNMLFCKYSCKESDLLGKFLFLII